MAQLALYQLPRSWNLPNASHFCCKLETYLRMSEIDYVTETAFPFQAPRGKVPFVKFNGRTISDTRIIIGTLKEVFGDRLDGALTPHELAVGCALQRLLEEHLYWVSMYERHASSDTNWCLTADALAASLPPVFRQIAKAVHRRRILSELRGHGLGRLQADEISALGRRDLDAVVQLLGDQPYVLGSHPTSFDATVFGFLINIVAVPIDSSLKSYALEKSEVVVYCHRMYSEFFPDLYDRNALEIAMGVS